MKWVSGAFLAALVAADGQEPAEEAAKPVTLRPVAKVIALLKEMRTTMEKDQKADEEFHKKMTCWCGDNEKKKGEAVKAAEAKIASLENEIKLQTAAAAQAAATIEFETKEIEGLKAKIAQQMEELKSEYEEFKVTSKDQREMISTLGRALDALSGKAPSFLQVKQVLTEKAHHFSDVMRKDLWAVLGSLNEDKQEEDRGLSTADLFDEMFSGKKPMIASLAQQPTVSDFKGPISKAKSYNQRSGAIVGIISEMQDNAKKELQEMMGAFKAKALNTIALAANQKILAEYGFNSEFTDNLGLVWEEIPDGSMVAMMKTKEQKVADAKQDKAAAEQAVSLAKRSQKQTKESLGADQQALIEITEKCKTSAGDYEARQAERAEEIKAVGEALGVLTADTSRDLMASSLNRPASFLQESTSAQATLRNRAAANMMQIARKIRSSHLAALAVRTQLDSFEKVKKAMDTMLAELKSQQKEETEQKATCQKELNENESETTDKTNEKEDLESTIADLEAQMDKTSETVATAKEQVKGDQISIKSAGETRADENKDFQQTVNDQRMTVAVLNKALAKLEAFYNKDAALMQQEPASVADAPKAKEYKQQGAAPGVMGLIQRIIADAQQLEKEAMSEEQKAQKDYVALVATTHNSIKKAEAQIATGEKKMGMLEGEKAARKQDLLASHESLEGLHSENEHLHLKCDYLLKNFDLRQDARQQEMDAIAQAKAVLSGASFQ